MSDTSKNMKMLYASIWQRYSYWSRVQQDVGDFMRQWPNFTYSQGMVGSTQGSIPVIALTGAILYNFQNQQYPLQIVLYLDYTYPQSQPRVLIQAAQGTVVRPDGLYICSNGTMRDFPQWNSSNTLIHKVQMMQNHFANYTPVILASAQQPQPQVMQQTQYTMQQYQKPQMPSQQEQPAAKSNSMMAQATQSIKSTLTGTFSSALQTLSTSLNPQKPAYGLPQNAYGFSQSTGAAGFQPQLPQTTVAGQTPISASTPSCGLAGELQEFKERCMRCIQQYTADHTEARGRMKVEVQQIREQNIVFSDQCSRLLLEDQMDQVPKLQVLEDADDYEIIDGAREYIDQLDIKRCEITAKKAAVNDIVSFMVEQETDIPVVQRVLKEVEDVRGYEILQAIRAGM